MLFLLHPTALLDHLHVHMDVFVGGHESWPNRLRTSAVFSPKRIGSVNEDSLEIIGLLKNSNLTSGPHFLESGNPGVSTCSIFPLSLWFR
jgi:hypothetical protein